MNQTRFFLSLLIKRLAYLTTERNCSVDLPRYLLLRQTLIDAHYYLKTNVKFSRSLGTNNSDYTVAQIEIRQFLIYFQLSESTVLDAQ